MEKAVFFSIHYIICSNFSSVRIVINIQPNNMTNQGKREGFQLKNLTFPPMAPQNNISPKLDFFFMELKKNVHLQI